MSAASDDFPSPDDEPTRALLLAQALDVCISAERRLPGSADHIIAHQPTWAREELRRLVSLAGSLDAVATSAVMSDEFRVEARGRLLQRIRGGLRAAGGDPIVADNRWGISSFPSVNGYHPVAAAPGRKRRWVWRAGMGGVLAAALATAATVTASATALPGEPLYSIKQAQEELGLRLAPDDQARALAWLNQGDARLYETARLLEAGRTNDIAQTTRRFDEAIDRATTTFVVTIAARPAETPATADIETKLNAQQAQLESLILSAPEPARADLRQALFATERGLALVADTQGDRLIDRGTAGPSGVAAPVPTSAVEGIPTVGQPPVAVEQPTVAVEPPTVAVEPPTVAQTSPRSANVVRDKHVAADRRDVGARGDEQSGAEQPTWVDATTQTSVEASPSPHESEVAVGRGAPTVGTPRGAKPARPSSSDDQDDEQHFEPVATDSGAIAQAPQISQQPVPRHLDIKLSDDAQGSTAQNGAGDDDERQVVTPTTTRGDDRPQVADQPQPAGNARSQGAKPSARTDSNDDGQAGSTASANPPKASTSSTGRTQTDAGDQRPSASRSDGDKNSQHGDNAPSSTTASHGNSDEHGSKGSGSGDQSGKSTPSGSAGRSGDNGGQSGGHGGDNGGHGGHGD